ncbi:MAG: hypothetical protein HY901_36520, partial [Deltaproteobacteria bacterium]|nr:hypothetical protein [Deltaproteobacteria bacterium]
TLAKAAVCYSDCERSDNWTTYVVSDTGHAALDTLYTGPLMLASPDSTVSGRVYNALFPTRVSSTTRFLTGVGGMLEAIADP